MAVEPPTPTPWTPQFTPEEWVYTDGSDIKGQPRLGAAVVHIPTRTTIYIDATGREETNTIMRAELVAIHTALATFAEHTWLGIFTDSLSSIQAIRLRFTRPGLSSAPHYHHHMLLLQSICHLLEARIEKGFYTTIRKIRAHSHIRGNDLADTAAKLAVTDFDTLPTEQTLRVDTGAIAPRPPFWVMYTANPAAPTPALSTGPRQATLRPPWWTIPEEDRLQMHAFTRPSHQLRQKVRASTLRSLHHTSLYMRLILTAKTEGMNTAAAGKALHTRLRENPKEGTNLLKFMYGQLYNGKLAKLYGHTPTDECPLCHLPDSCTHIAGECKAHKNLTIGRHNAACQLIHAAIRNSAKGGGALYSAKELRLVMADAGTQAQTTTEDLESLEDPGPQAPNTGQGHEDDIEEWLTPPPAAAIPRHRSHAYPFSRFPPPTDNGVAQHRRHVDVSQDPRYTDGDQECTSAPSRIPAWILPLQVQDSLFAAGHGTAPDLIYARGVPDSPAPDTTTFNRKKCNLILLEVGFCQDFGCDKRRREKTDKYAPLVHALQAVWGKVEFVAVPIGHAGTTLKETPAQLAQALSATRPEIEQRRARRRVRDPETDTAARTHDSSLFKSMMLTLTKLAQNRLSGIIHHRQSLVHAQAGDIRRTRASSIATPAQDTHQQGGTTFIHEMHAPRIPESTAIT
jgi:ribonuclease HI